jgi:hypothetical protein
MYTHILVSVAGDMLAAPQVLAAKTIPEVVDGLRFWIMTILFAVATLFMVISGLQRISANGDPGQIEQSKLNFKNGLLGYALAVLAPVILQVLQGILGG